MSKGRIRSRTSTVAGIRIRIAWLLVVLGVVLIAAVVALTSPNQPSSALPGGASTPSPASAAYLPSGPVLTVNSDTIDSREFVLQLEPNEARVFQYFYDHYHVRDSAHFWTTPHGGSTPLSMLERITTAQVVRLTVQLEMARERGMVNDITYGSLVGNMAEVNKQRTVAVDEHKPVYGPTAFTEASYFDYVTGNLQAILLQSLEEAMPTPAVAVLEKLYGQLRDQDFLCPIANQQPAGVAADCASGQKYIPFSAVESQVLQAWKQDQVKSLIDARVSAAKVKISHTVYDKLVAP